MAVHYGPAKKQIGKNQQESVFAAARKERKEQAANRRRAEQAERDAKSASWQARQHILSSTLVRIHELDDQLTAYMTAYELGRRVIDMSHHNGYYHFTPVAGK